MRPIDICLSYGRSTYRSLEASLDEESASILFKNTFTTVNSKEAKQLLVKPVGSRWVLKTKRNPNESTRYKARLVIKGYETTDFGETNAAVGKLTTFRYLTSLVGRSGWIIDHLDVVTRFLNPEVDDDDIYMALPEGSISKKHFRWGGMAQSEWTSSIRAVRDTQGADYPAPSVNTTGRIAYRPPITVSQFLLALSVSYCKQTLWRCGQL